MNKKYVVIKTIAIFLCWLCIVSVTGCSSKEQSNSNELQTVISAGTTDDTEATEDWFADINSVSSEEISDALVDIDVNQVGYQPDDKKIAIVHNDYGSDTYTIVDESGNTVFSGRLSGYIMDNVTNEQVRIADFSNFCMPGTFYVMCGDESESFPFQIDDELYGEKIQGIIETLLGMHSEWTLEESAMNNEMDIATVGVTSIYNSEETKEVTGGWQATKESGRYVISACKSCADLLLAYELYGEGLSQELTSMKDKTLGNVILEEVKYEVNWMLKMQDEDTGAVYTKVVDMKGTRLSGYFRLRPMLLGTLQR